MRARRAGRKILKMARIAMNLRRFATLLTLALSLAPAALAADLFTIAAVPVDATAASAAEARNAAVARGQREAFRLLIQSLVARDDQRRAPQVNDARLNDLVQGFEIADERTSATRYIARLTVAFRPSAVRQLLRDAGVPYTESPGKPVLIVPVYEAGELRRLFDDPNPWRDAWAAREPHDGLVPLVLPVGDLDDVGAVNVDQALAGDEAALAKLAARYGAIDILVLEANVAGNRVGIGQHRYARGADTHVVDSFSLPGSGDADSFKDIVREIAARIEDDWKKRTAVRFDTTGSLAVTVPLSSLADLVAVRQKLGEAAEIESYEIGTMTRTSAQLVLRHFGEPARLATALGARDLELSNSGGFWTLRRATTAKP